MFTKMNTVQLLLGYEWTQSENRYKKETNRSQRLTSQDRGTQIRNRILFDLLLTANQLT